MKHSKLLTILCLLLSASIANAQEADITIKTSAQCGTCKTNIEKALMMEKGVRFAELDVKTQNARVIYNSKRTTPEQLRKAISGVGYDADELPADPVAVEKLKPCCKKGSPCKAGD
ncbi:MAG: heavy-metal-associated domain-containing protein [Bacteroidota bacterium]